MRDESAIRIECDGELWIYDGCSFGELQDALLSGVCGQCGCGNPDDQAELIHAGLRLIDERKGYDQLAYAPVFGSDRMWMFFLHWADDKNLTEHGSGVQGSWLTDKGESLKDLLGWALRTEDS